MSNEIEGLDEFINELNAISENAENVLLAITSAEDADDPVQKIREDLSLQDRPRQIPMIQASSEEEAQAKIDEVGGLDKYNEIEWLGEDLGDYIVGE